MKRFFYTVFGGLGAVIFGVMIAYAGHMAWLLARPAIATISLPTLSDVTAAVQPGDGTSISGFMRTVRFSADEEEDLIDAAAHALPSGSDKSVTALAYVVTDLDAGTVAVSHDADRLLPIASLSKLVTAVVARKLLDPGARITISQDVMATYGNTAQFKVGETLTASDLYYPLLMVSSNDTAEAYARSYGRAKFISAMNDFVQSISAYRTYFEDPSGLSPENVSTANDLALILKWIRVNDPEIIAITGLKTKTVRSHTWINPTHFLNMSNYLGGKNGYIPEADRTAASLFALGNDKHTYAVIVLGSDSRDADELKLIAKVK